MMRTAILVVAVLLGLATLALLVTGTGWSPWLSVPAGIVAGAALGFAFFRVWTRRG